MEMKAKRTEAYQIIVLITVVSVTALIMSLQAETSVSDTSVSNLQADIDKTKQHQMRMFKTTNKEHLADDNSAKFASVSLMTNNCPGLPVPQLASEQQQFQKLNNTNHYFFSAFHDDRNNIIRIIGIVDVSLRTSLRCQIWFTDSLDVFVSAAMVSMIPETHGLRYSPVQLKCALPDRQMKPRVVSLVKHQCEAPDNLFVIQPATFSNPTNDSFGVCVSPLNEKFDDVYRFVEYMEVNQIFGASHFVYYNYTVGHNVTNYLKRYIKEGLASLVQWPLPVNNKNIHYYGQLAALNDCFYRLASKVRYIIFTDLDEFLVPRTHKNWSELIHHISEKGKTAKFGIFTFLCTFFKIEYPSDETLSNDPDFAYFHPTTILKMRRERKIFPEGQRSKYIADAKEVDTVGVHQVWAMHSGSRSFVVPKHLGLLHHYRFWDTPNDRSWVEDKYMHKFSSLIMQHMKDRFRVMGVTRSP